MEHREAARMASAEARPRDSDPDPDHVRRFARFLTPPIARWFAPPRLVPILLAVAVAVSALVVVGTQAVRSAVRWLDGPAPVSGRIPRDRARSRSRRPGIAAGRRGSSTGSARTRPGAARSLSVLDEDLEALANDFKLYSWVTRVVRGRGGRTQSARRSRWSIASRSPGRSSRSAGRSSCRPGGGHPAARGPRPGGGGPPGQGLRPEACPATPGPGSPGRWATRPEAGAGRPPRPGRFAAGGLPETNGRPGPARGPGLAVRRRPSRRPSLDTELWCVQLFDEVTGDELLILWGEPPGAEAPGEPSAEAKWAMLRDWARRNTPQPVQAPRTILRFTKRPASPIARRRRAGPAASPDRFGRKSASGCPVKERVRSTAPAASRARHLRRSDATEGGAGSWRADWARCG